MITMAHRIQQLRAERGVSAPALSAALGLPRTAVEKFEAGRQTPTQDQQQKLASFFGVSAFYLRGESDDRTQMSDWMDGAFLDEPSPAPAPARPAKKVAVSEDGAIFDAFLNSKKFQGALRTTVLEVLRSPDGQALIEKAVRRTGSR
ncbi:putative Xre family DNA-binding protein [Oscillibacter valericigenes Sjm18-20]|nr:putative Xre family DNA-binding protein [Oscillibacter valericigenes Sjm18-20]